MNNPVNYDFPTHYQSDGLRSFTITLRYKSGNPVDLTGATVRMQLRNYYTSATSFTFGTSEGEGALILEPNGVIRFPDINSWAIMPGRYAYDIEVTDSRGFVRTYMKGNWYIKADITKQQ